jgi:hypothetical protein
MFLFEHAISVGKDAIQEVLNRSNTTISKFPGERTTTKVS